jgi:hypothetical protein
MAYDAFKQIEKDGQFISITFRIIFAAITGASFGLWQGSLFAGIFAFLFLVIYPNW